jgi:hypothetical protein
MISADNYGKAKEIFKRLSDEKDNILSPRALLAFAVAGVNHGEKDSALSACREITMKYAESPYADAARTLKKALLKTAGGKSLALVKTSTGKILKHKTTLIIPNGSDWDMGTDGLGRGDLVIYHVRCLSRNPCKIVRSFKISLDSGEPQPPKSKGNAIAFLRAPVLYVRSMDHNFDCLSDEKK